MANMRSKRTIDIHHFGVLKKSISCWSCTGSTYSLNLTQMNILDKPKAKKGRHIPDVRLYIGLKIQNFTKEFVTKGLTGLIEVYETKCSRAQPKYRVHVLESMTAIQR